MRKRTAFLAFSTLTFLACPAALHALSQAPSIFHADEMLVEYLRRFLRDAPIHLQAAILYKRQLRDENAAYCVVYARAERIFRGVGLPASGLFRIILPCDENIVNRPSSVIANNKQTGAPFFEAYLRHFGPSDGFHLAGVLIFYTDAADERFRYITQLTDAPQIRLPEPPKDYNSRSVEKGLVEETDPSTEMPPRYPKSDVTIYFQLQGRPGEQFRSYFDSKSWRTVTRIDGPWQEQQVYRISDAFTKTSYAVDPVRHVYWNLSKAPDFRLDHYGMLPIEVTDTIVSQGRIEIAGLACEMLDLHVAYRGAFDPRICVTDDGIVLKRHESGYDMEAVRVTYGSLIFDNGTIPDGYEEILP